MIMRDYRDAKAMARTLREALKTRSLELTHSEGLELIATTFGVRDWNTLAARIEASRPTTTPKQAALRCSFCGKAPDQVGVLIAGPGAATCNECVELCDGILLEQAPFVPQAGPPAAQGGEALAHCTAERLVLLKTHAAASLANGARLLDLIAAIGTQPALSDDEADPQRRFIARKSPAERQTYADDVARRMAAIESLITTVTGLLDQRGGAPA
jgi:hypothetical protein